MRLRKSFQSRGGGSVKSALNWLTIGFLVMLDGSSVAFASEACPGGPTDFKSLRNRATPIKLGSEPVRINPGAGCEITWWFSHCLYVRQTGTTNKLGPF